MRLTATQVYNEFHSRMNTAPKWDGARMIYRNVEDGNGQEWSLRMVTRILLPALVQRSTLVGKDGRAVRPWSSLEIARLGKLAKEIDRHEQGRRHDIVAARKKSGNR